MKPPFYQRYLIIVIACAIFGLATVIQMVRINYTSYAQELIAKSEEYQGVSKTIYPPRGNIYDRKGNILAGNQIGYEVGIDLKVCNRSGFDRFCRRFPAGRIGLHLCFWTGQHRKTGW